MITKDDVRIQSAYSEVHGKYLQTATLSVMANDIVEGDPSNPRMHVALELNSWKLKDQLLDYIYGDIRRQLDKAEEMCRAFDFTRPVVEAAFLSVRKVLEGGKTGDQCGQVGEDEGHCGSSQGQPVGREEAARVAG